jgi:cleavage and polyadenylation specificity factor subunit 3
VLVHGEQNEMGRLKAALIREYEDDTEHKINVHNPKNAQRVTLHFKGSKTAKVSIVPKSACGDSDCI